MGITCNLIIVNKNSNFTWNPEVLMVDEKANVQVETIFTFLKHSLHALRYLDYLITILMLSVMAVLVSLLHSFYLVLNNNEKNYLISRETGAAINQHTYILYRYMTMDA